MITTTQTIAPALLTGILLTVSPLAPGCGRPMIGLSSQAPAPNPATEEPAGRPASEPPAPGNASSARRPTEARPFRPWDGVWEGTFKTFRTDGTKVSEIRVRQEYTSRSDDEQHGTIEDRYADGTVVRSEALNIRENGTLECRVRRLDTDETTIHTGRIEDGYLFWFRNVPERHIEECFRETIVSDTVYEIEGVGIYGRERDTVLLFSGRYLRRDGPPGADPSRR